MEIHYDEDFDTLEERMLEAMDNGEDISEMVPFRIVKTTKEE